ncbi:uncharacterized protein LOC108249818 isoform X2 [Kryptolebias marmoratus]|uniref:uncharacterized protein LOC108249818 isoform X2 n=1 Tax=Kryptolebias marmoratus TaxID=37003 RepID=UPI000D5310B9|nr:uncharacterized protein LOC108249818 isoform X2 [Kryptolebias marmoratus]
MESGSSAAPGNMSKTDILRGIITEKLSTAAREILAVVERTVADYEEEASAFRQEIDRQRRQLELLQPPYCIKVEPTDPDEQSLFSVCGAGGWDVLSKEEQHRYEIGSGNSWNLENLKDPTEKEVRKDGEENPTQEQEYGTVSRGPSPGDLHCCRFSPPAVQTDPVNVGRPAVKDLENLVNLRICILRDWDIQVLSNVVFKKYPFHELECPCGLQEDEFLNLLRSIFPPLASDKPFDFFITDRTKKLYPLKVESFTPEQVSKAVGNSALYIRLKRPAELQAGHEEPRQDFRKKDEEDNDPSVRAAPSTRNETSQKKHPQHRMAFKDNPVNLRIHILEESGVDVVLPQALNKSPPHELRCPCGLKEADFLDLLTSTFPQLAGGRPFTVLAEEGGELHPVKVESVTPEEIRRSSRSTGSPVIYIQLKKELPPPKDAAPENPPSSSHPSCPNTRPQSAEADRPVELKVCILDDPNIDVITASVFQKAAVVDLRCPAGLQEANFLDFFTSNFPVLEGKAFDLLARHGNKLRPLNVKNPTPEKIQLSVSSFSEAVLYVRLKEQQDEARKARSDVSDPTKASTRKFHKMDTKAFYDTRPHVPLALVPANPQDSDADLSDPDDDYQLTQADDRSDRSSDEDEAPSASRSSVQPPRKEPKKVKHTLKTVCLEEMEDTANPSSPSGPNQSTTRIWNHEDIEEFEVPNPKFEPPEAVHPPFWYFRMFFTDEMIEHVAHHTNLYSAQELADPVQTSPKEMKDFVAILLYMGVFSFPSLEDYWHHDSRFSAVADIMSRDRFQVLHRFIHFNDNQQSNESPDRFHKIRPLFEMLRERCLLIPSANRYSVDEVRVAYEGTRAGSLCQYANEPGKWGFKVFCRADSSGIIHDLLLFQGASTFFNVALSDQEQRLPLRAKLVTTLCKTIQQPQLSVVCCDNFFTSFSLVQSLHTSLGVRFIGAVQPNLTGGAPLMADSELMEKGRGAFDYRSAEGVVAVKWVEKKCVNLLSSACGILPLSAVDLWSEESRTTITVPCPSLVPAYREHMRGPDLSDMLVHLYRTPARSSRWYIPLFGYILDLCIVNSWLVYKRDCVLLNQKPMSLKRFRLAVAHSLNHANKPESKAGRPSLSPLSQRKGHTPRPSRPKPHPDVRYDGLGHWPLHCAKRGRCNLCPKGVSRWKCQKCNVFLCLNTNQECFVSYHQKWCSETSGLIVQPHR